MFVFFGVAFFSMGLLLIALAVWKKGVAGTTLPWHARIGMGLMGLCMWGPAYNYGLSGTEEVLPITWIGLGGMVVVFFVTVGWDMWTIHKKKEGQ
ncbi:MAG: hypothetical protein COT89_01620 [Candidatus Colwellbacteria bacterium CG10_big_fil_rev_8_21_14_0_10_42_22]|uniref:Uncharacterized protein n=1 Tax=Candidatus Colwellbacteria bacterium CG10_big_fil_rev_8_21_14_0_10_42_22 TaxID=1974540 RepID=A0A2H0VFP2_9BACT|nr:MAG: hypothetical protein COT89_01620 [Candidatus Colwellbacteria bacterium CG10_big_fil_rev_8_21_14_0_10_42_22]